MWFVIKADSSIIKGPYHKLLEIQMLQKDARSKKVKEIAKRFVERGTWHAHTEPLLVSLLSSDDASDRKFAINNFFSLPYGKEFAHSLLQN